MRVARTAHRTLTVCRAGVAGAAATVLLAACGGDGGSSTDNAASSAADTGAAASGDFCDQARNIDERVDAVLSELDDGSSVPEAINAAADELRAIEAPAAISADWSALVEGLEEIGDAFANLDITDADSVAALEEVQDRLTTAGTNVENYLQDECGID
jgi:hypothetical protein